MCSWGLTKSYLKFIAFFFFLNLWYRFLKIVLNYQVNPSSFLFFSSDGRHGSHVKPCGTSLQTLIARVQTEAAPLVQL